MRRWANPSGMAESGNVYESDELVEQYLLFHYGESEDILPWQFGPYDALGFPQRCVQEGLAGIVLPGKQRALDLGCAVGRSSFELARTFDEVIGVDFSAAFIAAATALSAQGTMEIGITETGVLRRRIKVSAPHVAVDGLHFEVGDAQQLRVDLGSFDYVLAANLLCRLQRPQALLARMADLVVQGGCLVITTPNTWLEAFTAREFWLAGTPETAEPLEALRSALEPAFCLERTWDMPFLIREHRRKFQWSVAQATRWIRQTT